MEAARVRSTAWQKQNPEKAQAWQKRNREKANAANRAWRKRNPDKYKAAINSWRQRNPLKVKAIQAAWCERQLKGSDVEAYRKQKNTRLRAWQKLNPEACRGYSKTWNERNPGLQRALIKAWGKRNSEKIREYKRRHEATKRASRLIALNPLTLPGKKTVLAVFGNLCAYCGDSQKLSIDHVLPVSRGGLDEAGNILPACKRCNSSKNARPVEIWYRRQPFFIEERWDKIKESCPDAVAGQASLGLARS
jgi:5-methylcytosine-specific restriction endonuclease McrA